MKKMKKILTMGLLGVLCLVATISTVFASENITIRTADGSSIPSTVYRQSGQCKGIAVVSPGAGGSNTGYVYLGNLLSQQGWLTVVVNHSLSDKLALDQYITQYGGITAGLEKLTTTAEAYKERTRNIHAALYWATLERERAARTTRGPGRGSTSGQKLLIGHSMGASDVMMEAGALNNMDIKGQDSFDAYIALSPQGLGPVFPDAAWAGINKPVLSITGTKDDDLYGATYESRLIPLREMRGKCQWSAIIDGSTHMNFADKGLDSKATVDAVSKIIPAFLKEEAQGGFCRIPSLADNIVFDRCIKSLNICN